MRTRSFLLISAIVVALASPARGLDFGIGAQVTGAQHSLSGNLPSEGEWGGEFGWGAGLSFDLGVSRDVALSFQPSYTQRPSHRTTVVNGVEVSRIDFDLDYLALPLVCRVAADPGGVRGFVTAGLSFGVLLSAEATSGSEVQDIQQQFDDVTIGALFGVGMMIPVAGHSLTIELRYEQGLDDIVNRDASPVDTFAGEESESVKYRLLMLQVGYLFGLGGE